MTSTEVATDPFARVSGVPRLNVGDRVSTWDYYNDSSHGIWTSSGYTWCGLPGPTSGYACTRPHGHPDSWVHVAASTDGNGGRSYIREIWGPTGAVADPYEGRLAVGSNVTTYDGWDNRTTGLHVSTRCDAVHSTGAYRETCKRPFGHPKDWACVGSDNSGIIEWFAKLNEPLFVDPEDGTPEDPETSVYTEKPVIGSVVRLRDRENRLYVMGHRTEVDEVEVLDLKRDEMRAIPTDRTVQCEVPLTVAELGQVAKWYAKHREAVRKIAVREYRRDRWCMQGLNDNLRTLGLEPYVPVLTGTIRVEVPFEYPDTTAGQSLIEDRVRSALAPPEVSAALRLALPSIEGVEIESTGLTVSATNFSRK